jgi:hypothetical protein
MFGQFCWMPRRNRGSGTEIGLHVRPVSRVIGGPEGSNTWSFVSVPRQTHTGFPRSRLADRVQLAHSTEARCCCLASKRHKLAVATREDSCLAARNDRTSRCLPYSNVNPHFFLHCQHHQPALALSQLFFLLPSNPLHSFRS